MSNCHSTPVTETAAAQCAGGCERLMPSWSDANDHKLVIELAKVIVFAYVLNYISEEFRMQLTP